MGNVEELNCRLNLMQRLRRLGKSGHELEKTSREIIVDGQNPASW